MLVRALNHPGPADCVWLHPHWDVSRAGWALRDRVGARAGQAARGQPARKNGGCDDAQDLGCAAQRRFAPPVLIQHTPWHGATQGPEGPPNGHRAPRLMAEAGQDHSQALREWSARNSALPWGTGVVFTPGEFFKPDPPGQRMLSPRRLTAVPNRFRSARPTSGLAHPVLTASVANRGDHNRT